MKKRIRVICELIVFVKKMYKMHYEFLLSNSLAEERRLSNANNRLRFIFFFGNIIIIIKVATNSVMGGLHFTEVLGGLPPFGPASSPTSVPVSRVVKRGVQSETAAPRGDGGLTS